MITNDQFRQNFPAFADTGKFSEAMLTMWLGFAYQMLGTATIAPRWGVMLDLGAQLFAAHNLALDALANAEAANGAPPGSQVGPASSKSVGGVSISYDVGAGVNAADTHWNLTSYGTRFARLYRMAGAGPLQVGIGQVPPFNGGGWPGVVQGSWTGTW